jgi:uncharacterized ion transporter superfamily protein YfcC
MNTQKKLILSLPFIITLASVITWQITGGDYYTKFEVVEEVEQSLDPNDPLVIAGFYENQESKQTVVRKEFRFGLLPTPNGLIDKHVIAVVTFVLPAWVIAFDLLWWQRRRNVRILRERRPNSSVFRQ